MPPGSFYTVFGAAAAAIFSDRCFPLGENKKEKSQQMRGQWNYINVYNLYKKKKTSSLKEKMLSPLHHRDKSIKIFEQNQPK